MVKYYFVPEDDIETHELARLMPLLVGGFEGGEPQNYNAQRYMHIHSNEIIEDLPTELRRHFTTDQPDSPAL